MKKFLQLSIGFMISAFIWSYPVQAAPIGTIGNIDNLNLGGVTLYRAAGNLIVLHGTVGGAGAGITTLRKGTASAGYQVTSGKTMTVYVCQVIENQGASTTGGYTPADSTNDAGNAGNTALSSPLYPSNVVSGAVISTSATAGAVTNTPLYFTVAATHYFSVTNQAQANGGTITCWAYED